MNDNLSIIVTQGPYSPFLDKIVKIDTVRGIRLNTIMPIRKEVFLSKISALQKEISPKIFWIDLKSKQLRVSSFANTPYTAVSISHEIEVELPTKVYFDNGNTVGEIVDIDKNQLILENYVGRMIGPGEGINIPSPSLKIKEPKFLTQKDIEYVNLCKQLGINYYMLSFTENKDDIENLRSLHPHCIIAAKIENIKGLENLTEISKAADYIVAARGDLFTEIDYPHHIGNILKNILKVGEKKAILASRLLHSLLVSNVPSCSDIMDILYLKEMGYKTFMIGDDICFDYRILTKAIRILNAI